MGPQDQTYEVSFTGHNPLSGRREARSVKVKAGTETEAKGLAAQRFFTWTSLDFGLIRIVK